MLFVRIYKICEDYMKPVNILLSEKTIQDAKVIAEMEQIPYSVLFRNWIVQRIREYAPVQPSEAETGAATPNP